MACAVSTRSRVGEALFLVHGLFDVPCGIAGRLGCIAAQLFAHLMQSAQKKAELRGAETFISVLIDDRLKIFFEKLCGQYFFQCQQTGIVQYLWSFLFRGIRLGLGEAAGLVEVETAGGKKEKNKEGSEHGYSKKKPRSVSLHRW